VTIKALHSILVKHGVRPNAYCLTGGLPNEAYAIEQVHDRWQVYYSERGQRSGLREFSNESDACRELLTLIRNDDSTRTL
jgi:hypothetical protein